MKELPAAIVTAVSLVLCFNVYAVLFAMYQPQIEEKLRRKVHYYAVTYQQTPREKRVEFALFVVGIVALVTWYMGAM